MKRNLTALAVAALLIGTLATDASARGGVVKVTMAGDRVLLGGQAVTVMTGELLA